MSPQVLRWRRPCMTHRRMIDLEINRVERIDSTENRSTPSTPSTRFPLFKFIGLFIFRCATSVEQRVFSSSCLFVCHNHGQCSWSLDNSQTTVGQLTLAAHSAACVVHKMSIYVFGGMEQNGKILDRESRCLTRPQNSVLNSPNVCLHLSVC